jgi:hypothetical protein
MKKSGGLAQFGKLARPILMFSSATWAINGGHGFSTVGQPAAVVTFAAGCSGFSELWRSNGLTCWIEQRVKLLFQGLDQGFRSGRFLHGCGYNFQHALGHRETA